MKDNSKQFMLFINGLRDSVGNNELFELFSKYSAVSTSISRDRYTKRSRGCGYAVFDNELKAKEALSELNYTKIRNKAIRICWFDKNPQAPYRNPNCKIFVKHLPNDVTSKSFHSYFSQYGNVVVANLIEDEFRKHYNFGFVIFETPKEALNAIEKANNTVWLEKKLTVVRAEKTRKEKHYTKICVRSLPKEVKKEQIKEEFEEYGDISTITVKEAKPESLAKMPKKRRRFVENKKVALINFKDPSTAKKIVDEVTYMKRENSEYNTKIKTFAKEMPKIGIEEQDKYRAAARFIELYPLKKPEDLANEARLASRFKEEFAENKKYFGKRMMPRDKESNLQCSYALSKKQRERKTKRFLEKMKRRNRKNFKIRNLFARNFPENMKETELKQKFEAFGPLKSFTLIDKHANANFSTGNRTRYCFISYFEAAHAKACRETLGSGEDSFYVSIAKGKRERNKPEEKGREEEKQLKPSEKDDLSVSSLNKAVIEDKTFAWGSKSESRESSPSLRDAVEIARPQGIPELSRMSEQDSRWFRGENFYGRLLSIPALSPYEDLFEDVMEELLDIKEETLNLKLLKDHEFFLSKVKEIIRSFFDETTCEL